jgi:bacterioferritin
MAASRREEIVEALIKAYWMEIETVMNYVACAADLDGVRAEEIREALAADVDEELGHAREIAGRIRDLRGRVPGSLAFRAGQKALQPPADSTDVASVIRGVLEAEGEAIEQYRRILALADGEDPVTQDLAVRLLAGEEKHRRAFEGYLAEYARGGR